MFFSFSSFSVVNMSKATVKKLHWRSKVQESFVPLGGASGELGVAIGGGADYGEFPFVTAAPGGGATVGDVIIEIGGTSVLGLTLGDVRGVLNSCPHPIRIKTVSPGTLFINENKLTSVWLGTVSWRITALCTDPTLYPTLHWIREGPCNEKNSWIFFWTRYSL